MILGEYTSSITAGKRIAVPKMFRERLGEESLIITRGYEQCLVLVGKGSFEQLLSGVLNIPFISTEKRETSRFLLSSAQEVTPDDQGRVVLADNLLQYAGLSNKEVVFIGVGMWVEIWDKEVWQKYQRKLDRESSTIADRLMTLNTKSS
jgi:MraZ protein